NIVGGHCAAAPRCEKVGPQLMSLILFRDIDCPAGCPVQRGFLFRRIRSLRNTWMGRLEVTPPLEGREPAEQASVDAFRVIELAERPSTAPRASRHGSARSPPTRISWP